MRIKLIFTESTLKSRFLAKIKQRRQIIYKSNKLYINKIEFVIIRLIRVILFFTVDSVK